MSILSKKSINMIEDMNKNKNNTLKLDKLSKNKYFNNLFNKILKIYKSYDEILTLDNININNCNINISDDSYFIGTSLRNNMKNLKNKYIINFNNIQIYFITNKDSKKIKIKILKLLKVILTIKKLFDREKASQKITIYDINESKRLPKKDNSIIGPGNCNSGYCNVLYHQNKNGDIVLYRNEEFYKVLIHELIHSNFIDYGIIMKQKDIHMDNKICTDYNILLNEAFTETFSCLINMTLVHYHTNIKIDEIFKNEVKLMITNFNKIMHHFKIKRMKDIIVDNGCKRYFLQNTNVFSYYILKTINYLNIDNFLKIMSNNCDKNYSINNLNYNEEYVKYVFKNIYFMDKYIKKKDTSHIKDTKIRLSLYELSI